MPSEKREASSSSQHGDAIGSSLSLHCKFEINLGLFAIWLVAMKFHVGKIRNFMFVPSKKREASSSSQHGDAIGCPLSPYCKFEINLTLFAIWLVAIKFTPTIA